MFPGSVIIIKSFYDRQTLRHRACLRKVLAKRKRSRSAPAVLHSPATKYKWKQWTNEQMLDVMDDVYSGIVGVNEAAHKHGVLPTTVKDRISDRAQHRTNSGPINVI